MLHVHRAERADALADVLAAILADPLDDPLSPEVVAVPTRGMERWLTQRMSIRLGVSENRGDGVCANVTFPSPGKLIAHALLSATGLDPQDDPWAAERLVWPLLETVDECLGEAWLQSLASHIGVSVATEREPRRFAAIRHVADLYHHYGIRRPEMIQAWARGEGDLGGWQPELWRRLRERIATASPAERLDPATRRLVEDPGLLGLPRRIALFGLTRLPASYLQVLGALAAARDVHLFVLHPSPRQWQHIAELTAARVPIRRRRDDHTGSAVANRLLSSWGQDARELQLVLGAQEHIDHHHPIAEPVGTLLGRLQADIRHDRSPPGPPLRGQPEHRPRLNPEDGSLQVHACHGRARQVEVMRDAILHLLEADSTLEPRDVIVMCPDIEVVAPLIQAAFGAGRRSAEADEEPAGEDPDAAAKRLPDLRVRLADRSLRQTNPILGVVSLLLDLPAARVTASQLLDLADRGPVRRRFGFDDDEVARMEGWAADSGIRWGLDDTHRRPFKLDAVSANTWRFGLDRILLGVAMTEEHRRLLGGVLPLDDVESGAIDLAGRLAEFVDRVRTAVDQLSQAQTIAAWALSIAAAADALTATRERDSWQRTELQRILETICREAAGESERDSETVLELADMRALLADRLKGRPTRANFRTGHLTVCTLVPMRSVPHRVVCLLGLDDGEFPRKSPRDGDDRLLDDPHVGDRDPRAEDRQMLLDALLAARERLIITYTGNDERTNLPRPPAIPVAELLDVVDRTVCTNTGRPRDQIEIRHPLQPFDPRNFADSALIPGSVWSFDPVALGGARALIGPRAPKAPFLASRLPRPEERIVELDSLVRFVEHPVRALLSGRLGISVRESHDRVRDALPVELDNLEEWAVGQCLLQGLLASAEIEACVRAEQARGSLPPGMLAVTVLARVRPVVLALADEAREHAPGPATSLDVNLALGDGRTLAGTVAGVHGNTLCRVAYSRVKSKDRIAAWVRLLALSAARPLQPFASVVVGRARAQAPDAVTTAARIPALASDAEERRQVAQRHLAVLIDLYDRGMRELLPLAAQASAAYAHAAAGDSETAARAAWESAFRFEKEDRDPEHLLAYGGQIALAELLAQAPGRDEHGDGWAAEETTRFGRYARRLWDGLLAVEELRDR
ncbi:MAG: exodeoxyribonuclease V subunit gamma [Solirubrobacteraceae bacterium]